MSPSFLPGGGFEWDDDFSPDPFLSRTTSHVLSTKPALQHSKYFSPPPPRSAEPSWPHAAACSRFSITPASIASFSLTHLTDSDMEQGGEAAVVRGRGAGGAAERLFARASWIPLKGSQLGAPGPVVLLLSPPRWSGG